MTDGTERASFTRREYTIGAGALGFLGLGSLGAYLTTSGTDTDASFVLQQGHLRWEVEALSDGDRNVEQFYNVEGTSANPTTDIIAEDAASRLFIYDGPVDDSLVFLHGSRDVDHGGTARFSFSGLSRSKGEWAVRDDPRSVSDDFEPWDGGNAVIEWEWGENTTDGGAYWGVLDRQDFTVTVTPKTLRGVDSWVFLSGDADDPERFELSQERPVKIKPTKGRKRVVRANVEIMPDTDPNEFDPYAQERMTVAVRAPPADADASEWVDPDGLDPGNYSVNFGSRAHLAGGNAAQPQRYYREDGVLYLEYKTSAANFTLDSAYGFLVGKTDENTWFRGRDTVRPGGFNNAATEPAELVLTDRNVDPADSDFGSEYVEFGNDGDEPLDMGGWTVENDAGETYRFPESFSLDAHGSVRLRTGEGESDGDDRYWGRSEPAWDDDDTVRVTDANGSVVLAYDYPRA